MYNNIKENKKLQQINFMNIIFLIIFIEIIIRMLYKTSLVDIIDNLFYEQLSKNTESIIWFSILVNTPLSLFYWYRITKILDSKPMYLFIINFRFFCFMSLIIMNVQLYAIISIIDAIMTLCIMLFHTNPNFIMIFFGREISRAEILYKLNKTNKILEIKNISDAELYNLNEDIILNILIKEKLSERGENYNKINTKLNYKNINILYTMYGILTLINVLAFIFNYNLIIITIIQIILTLILKITDKKFYFIDQLVKKIKSFPDINIDEIINDTLVEQTTSDIPKILRVGIIIFVSIIMPMTYFKNPRFIFVKYGNGYELFRHTSNFAQVENVIIPKEYNGLPVISIGENAFKNNKHLKEVIMPEGLTDIKATAFQNNIKLKKVIFPSTLTEIRYGAFAGCTELEEIKLNEGLTSIRAFAFTWNEKLNNVVLPETLTYLGSGAFSHNYSLTKIKIPKSIFEINGETFSNCTSLSEVILHDNILSIHGETFIKCTSLKHIDLPPKIKEVRGNTFEGCTSLLSIVIPEGVTRIGGSAFRDCSSLAYVSIPNTLLEIGPSGFRNCNSLTLINIPNKTLIGERAFKDSPTIIRRY